MKRRKIGLLGALAILCAQAAVASAQDVIVGADFAGSVSGFNVGGGISHLNDGDLLAFTADYANGPSLVRVDANADANPAGGQAVLAQFDASVFPDFVQVSPSGKFALAGLSGGSSDILKVDLTTGAVTPYFSLPGNYDAVFVNDTTVYISANPSGFDPMGANEISLVQLSNPPVLKKVVSIVGTPSGPIALNSAGDLYYISSSFTFGDPGKLLKFSAADLAQAATSGIPLDAADSAISVELQGGFDIVFHPLTATQGELFISDFSDTITRVDEATLTPSPFATVDDPTAPGITALSLWNPAGKFDATGPTKTELAASIALDFFATNKLLQIRPKTFVEAERAETDEAGFCRSNEPDCIYQDLRPSACVGANGFLSQINIASVVNLQPSPLPVAVQYYDANGTLKGEKLAVISANLKIDFLVDDLGLKPDTVGTVCVATNAEPGAWSGGVVIYKPDARNGSTAFGAGFDFALFYPFLNPFRAPVTVSLNTYHLGTDPASTVANWIAITDAQRDGVPLTGKLLYFNEAGAQISQVAVSIPDGARRDFAGHEAIGGAANKDAIGMARFIPDPLPDTTAARYYLTVTRYFYDCPGSGCANFLTAFNLPYRPGTLQATYGGASTTNGEISIVELNNVAAGDATAAVKVFGTAGNTQGSPVVPVPARATRHVILNRLGQTGFLAEESVASAAVTPQSGYVSATSLFYKLDSAGRLEYGYAAPLTGTAGQAQISQFNSFISQLNVPEVFNSSTQPVNVTLDFYSYTGLKIADLNVQLQPKQTRRLASLAVGTNDYGTIVFQGDKAGVVLRNYVRRPGQYTLAFGGQ